MGHSLQLKELYYKARFEDQFNALKVPEAISERFLSKLAHLLRATEYPFNIGFYDINQSVRIYSMREKITPKLALLGILKDPAIICNIHGIKIKKAAMPKGRPTPLRLEDIKDTVLKTFERTKLRPTKHDGEAKYGALAYKESFKNIHQSFKRGLRALGDTGFKSLAAYIDSLGIPKNPHPRSSAFVSSMKNEITISKLVASATETIQRDHRIPTANNDMIKYGPLAGKCSWGTANGTVRRMKHEHQYTGLKDVLEAHCGEIAFMYAANSFLAKKFAQSAGIDYRAFKTKPLFIYSPNFCGPVKPAAKPREFATFL